MNSPCPCGSPQDPQVVTNPPGLDQISYQADDFTGFRRAMLRPLPGEQAIGTWRPAPGDLGLQVIEWWAYLAQILQFYNERHANESYLRTATRASSLANLVALLGYQPAPGIAATGNVAVTRTTSHRSEPLVIPAGMRLSSVATPGIPAQTFETGAATFPGPSSVPVTISPSTAFIDNADGSQSLLLAGRVKGIKAGDELLLVEAAFAGTNDNWKLITVTAVAPQTDPETGAINTLVTFTGSFGPTPAPQPPSAAAEFVAFEAPAFQAATFQAATFQAATFQAAPFEIAQPSVASLEIFNWNPQQFQTQPTAPPPSQATDYRLVRPLATAALWNAGGGNAAVEDNGTTVHLSAVVRGISPGDIVQFDTGSGHPSALAVVASVSEQFYTVPYPGSPSPTPPTIAVAHTVLTLDLNTDDSWVLIDVSDPTTVTVRCAFRDVGTIIGVPAVNLPSLPATLNVPSWYAPPPSAATAFLVDATGAGVLVTVTAAGTNQITVTGAGTPPATIGTPLVVPLQLLVDVVQVSRGRTVTDEVIGSGNAALINQTFTLAKGPLTYLAAGAGSVAALAVYVDGVRWLEVPSFYGQPRDARAYVVTRSTDQTVTSVTFGDGVNGARLTSGTGNVVATYRYGSGATSPPAGRLTTISQPQPNLASVQNPVAVSGGADPQSPGDVRVNAPASVFAFGRAISADDYEVVARMAPGVARVAAYWTFDKAEQRTLVTVYVGDDDAAVAAATSALAGSDDPNRPVSVLAATPIELSLSCTLVVAADRQVADVTAAAMAAISDAGGGLFSPGRMGIGERLYRSAVDRALSVPGVVAVHDLSVTWPITFVPFFEFFAPVDPSFLFELTLDEIFDPGEGSFFDLPPANVTIVGVTASG